MSKIGRNKPCFCGSGMKYKKCHGAILKPDQDALRLLPPEVQSIIDRDLRRQEAAIHNRRLMQGLGAPIISIEHKDLRIVVVKNRVFWSKNWRTFFDFLQDYIITLLGKNWYSDELQKPSEGRHSVVAWNEKLRELQRAATPNPITKIYSMELKGAPKAFYKLAYDLFVLAHNHFIPDSLLNRIKNMEQFEGALYEVYVAAIFARAGFRIDFEDESDVTSSHCEFEVWHEKTEKRFSVECKAFTNSSKRSGRTSSPPKVRDKIYSSLSKQSRHSRIVFIELNRADRDPMSWGYAVEAELTSMEANLTIKGEPAPPAYVFVTNRNYLFDVDNENFNDQFAGMGFKISDYPPFKGAKCVLDVVNARDRHIELFWLFKAISAHVHIPSSFDDRLPEEVFYDFDNRIKIGDVISFSFQDQGDITGTVIDGLVVEKDWKMLLTVEGDEGVNHLVESEMSQIERDLYRASPDTFFGIVKPVSRPHQNVLTLFDEVHSVYSQLPRSTILAQLAGKFSTSDLESKSDDELRKFFSAGIVESIWALRDKK